MMSPINYTNESKACDSKTFDLSAYLSAYAIKQDAISVKQKPEHMVNLGILAKALGGGLRCALAKGGDSAIRKLPMGRSGRAIINETFANQTFSYKEAENAVLDGINDKSYQHIMFASKSIASKWLWLDFDDKEGLLAGVLWPDVAEALSGCFVERSSSGRGWHAWCLLDDETAKQIRAGRGTGRFKLKYQGFGVDVDFEGKGLSWQATTGAAYPDEHSWVGCDGTPANRLKFRELLSELGLFETPASGGQGIKNGGKKPQAVFDEALQVLGVGIESASEVLSLVRQKNGLRDSAGKWHVNALTGLLDGQAEIVEQFFGGDWSSAELALVRELTYYTRDCDIISEVLDNCGLTKREEHPDPKKRCKNKWLKREDYAESTLKVAFESRLKSGQTYQSKSSVAVAKSEPSLKLERQDKTERWGLETELVGRGKNQIVRPVTSLSNAVQVLKQDPRTQGLFGVSELSEMTMAFRNIDGFSERQFPIGVLGGLHTNVVIQILEQTGMRCVTDNLAQKAIEFVACDSRFNPLAGRLREAEPWDGINRFSPEHMGRVFSFDCGNFSSDEDAQLIGLQCTLLHKWMRQIVARVKQPGCSAEGFLIFEGSQGIGKGRLMNLLSLWWDRALWAQVEASGAGVVSQLYCEHMVDIAPSELRDFSKRDNLLKIRGKLFFKVDELKGIDSKLTEQLKQMISSQADTSRKMYQNNADAIPRLGCFVGAMNGNDDLAGTVGFLSDATGSRRYWVIRIKTLDFDALVAEMGQMWSQVVHEVMNEDAEYWLSDDEIQLNNHWVSQFQEFGVWAEFLADLLEELRASKNLWCEDYSCGAKSFDGGFTLNELSDWLLCGGMRTQKLERLIGKPCEHIGVSFLKRKLPPALKRLGFVSFGRQPNRWGILK